MRLARLNESDSLGFDGSVGDTLGSFENKSIWNDSGYTEDRSSGSYYLRSDKFDGIEVEISEWKFKDRYDSERRNDQCVTISISYYGTDNFDRAKELALEIEKSLGTREFRDDTSRGNVTISSHGWLTRRELDKVSSAANDYLVKGKVTSGSPSSSSISSYASDHNLSLVHSNDISKGRSSEAVRLNRILKKINDAYLSEDNVYGVLLSHVVIDDTPDEVRFFVVSEKDNGRGDNVRNYYDYHCDDIEEATEVAKDLLKQIENHCYQDPRTNRKCWSADRALKSLGFKSGAARREPYASRLM